VPQHLDLARRIGLDPHRGFTVAQVPQQGADDQLGHRTLLGLSIPAHCAHQIGGETPGRPSTAIPSGLDANVCSIAMTHPAYLKEKPRELRIKKKLSLLEIAECLALPKTTIYCWICDLSDDAIKHRDTPGRSRARLEQGRRMKAEYSRRRQEAYQQGWDEFALLAAEPTFIDFVCMYIGEGYKRDRNQVALANSDLRVIRLADRWIRRFSRNPVTYSFQHHADQDPAYLIKFWSAGLGADPKLFTFQRKSNSGQLAGRNWRSKHGVLTVRAHDTALRLRLQAWMDQTQDAWLDSIHGV
jgi:hypothetical protein